MLLKEVLGLSYLSNLVQTTTSNVGIETTELISESDIIGFSPSIIILHPWSLKY